MKTRKKFMAFTLALILVVATSITSVGANETLSTQEREITDSLALFLEKNAQNQYMYENEEIDDSLTTVDTAQNALDNKIKRSDTGFPLSEFSVDPQLASYLRDKTAYVQHVRQDANIEREDFHVEYETEDITVNGDLAVVKIRETATFRYTDASESSCISLLYTVSLIRENDEWLITDMVSNDGFDLSYKETGFELNTAIADYETQKESDLFEATESENPDIGSRAATVVLPYNRMNAAGYANSYAINYNGLFTDHAPNDCQNFVSQCVWAGFGGSNTATDVNGHARPMDTTGPAQWYKDSGAWISNTKFREYLLASRIENERWDRISSDSYYCNRNRISDIPDARNRLVGATVQRSDMEHTVVIVDVQGLSPSQIFVCGHTGDQKYVKLSDTFVSTNDIYINIPMYMYLYDSGAAGLRVTADWLWPFAKNTTTTVRATASQTCYRMAMKVVAPNGQTTWLDEQYNTKSYRSSYRFTQKGFYHITAYARNVSESTSGSYSVSNTSSVWVS